MEITVSPAYGRDYKTKDALIKDWMKDLDFEHDTRVIFGGGLYVNKSDVLRDSRITAVTFRYHKLRKSYTVRTGAMRK